LALENDKKVAQSGSFSGVFVPSRCPRSSRALGA
jgi:hypothetical protein